MECSRLSYLVQSQKALRLKQDDGRRSAADLCPHLHRSPLCSSASFSCFSPLFSPGSDHHPTPIMRLPLSAHLFIQTFDGMLGRVYGCQALAQPLPGAPAPCHGCDLRRTGLLPHALLTHLGCPLPPPVTTGCLPGPSPHGLSISSSCCPTPSLSGSLSHQPGNPGPRPLMSPGQPQKQLR